MPFGILAGAIALNVALLALMGWGVRVAANRRFSQGEALLSRELAMNPREGEVVVCRAARCWVHRRNDRRAATVALTTQRIIWVHGGDQEEVRLDAIDDLRDASKPSVLIDTPARLVVTTGDHETTFEIVMAKPDLASWVEAANARGRAS